MSKNIPSSWSVTGDSPDTADPGDPRFCRVAGLSATPGGTAPQNRPHPVLAGLASGSASILDLGAALGCPPDAGQTGFLTAPGNRIILCCARQWGKSTMAAVRALHAALTRPGSHILIASRTHRQSLRLFVKIRKYAALLRAGATLDRSEDPALLFPNGSVIRSIPNNPAGERSLDAVHILVIDEAAFTPDDLYHALYPMLATTNGAIWLLSTPNARAGFFFEAWHDETQPWHRIHAPAGQCPRITPEFLAAAKLQNPEPTYRREYLAEFVETSEGLFLPQTITAVTEPPPPPPPDTPLVLSDARQPHFAGIDFGQRRDHTAIAIVRRVTYTSNEKRNAYTYEWLKYERLEVVHLRRSDLHQTFDDMAHCIAVDLQRQMQPKRIPAAIDTSGPGGEFRTKVDQRAGRWATTYPVTITSGTHETVSVYGRNVPRKDLLTRLAAALESGDLIFSPHLPSDPRAQLQAELRTLRADYSCAPGKNNHDDLVMALALAVWLAKKC